MQYLPWFTAFFMALRNMRSRLTRSFLTVLGISLGVAVVLAIDITNESTLNSLAGMFERAVGRSELQVVPIGYE